MRSAFAEAIELLFGFASGLGALTLDPQWPDDAIEDNSIFSMPPQHKKPDMETKTLPYPSTGLRVV